MPARGSVGRSHVLSILAREDAAAEQAAQEMKAEPHVQAGVPDEPAGVKAEDVKAEDAQGAGRKDPNVYVPRS